MDFVVVADFSAVVVVAAGVVNVVSTVSKDSKEFFAVAASEVFHRYEWVDNLNSFERKNTDSPARLNKGKKFGINIRQWWNYLIGKVQYINET